MSGQDPDELTLAQLLCSRVCHDLVGPVGAVNTAVELMADDDSGMDKEAFAVLERSVREAGIRLAFFRTAFGFGGGTDTPLGIANIMELVGAMAPAGKVAFEHDVISETGANPSALPGYAGKLALVLGLIGIDALPRGGSLSLHVAQLQDGIGLGIRAEGPGAAIKDNVRGVLDAAVSDAPSGPAIDARNVHAHLAWRLATRLSARLEVSSETDSIGIATLIPTP